jgi:hypothetical protein
MMAPNPFTTPITLKDATAASLFRYRNACMISHGSRVRVRETYMSVHTNHNLVGSIHFRLKDGSRKSGMVNRSTLEQTLITLYNFLMDLIPCSSLLRSSTPSSRARPRRK